MSFIDPNVPFEEFACKTEPNIEIEEIDEKVDFKIQPKTEPKSEATKPEPEPTFDGNWSSDDDATYVNDDSFDSDDEPLSKLKLKVPQKKTVKTVSKEEFFDKPDQSHTRDFFWSHKKNSLAGKIACKYCESIFETRDEQVAHDCKYLKCHARNFICRVCGKELSRKTFSNHLHETLACQYCNKKFVNPRSMKTHMMRQHKVQNLVAPTTYKERREILNQQKEIENGGKRKTYPKKRIQRECGKETMHYSRIPLNFYLDNLKIEINFKTWNRTSSKLVTPLRCPLSLYFHMVKNLKL